MWWCTVYKAMSDGKQVIRVHAIGEPQNIPVELTIGTLNFHSLELLAVVQCLRDGEEEARDVARYYAEQLNCEVEL